MRYEYICSYISQFVENQVTFPQTIRRTNSSSTTIIHSSSIRRACGMLISIFVSSHPSHPTRRSYRHSSAVSSRSPARARTHLCMVRCRYSHCRTKYRHSTPASPLHSSTSRSRSITRRSVRRRDRRPDLGETWKVQYSTRLGGCYGQVVRDVDAPVGFRVFDKPTSES